MKRFLRGKKAQSTAEYAILLSLVIAAVIGMQTYAKRGVQGRFRDAVDKLATDTSSTTDLGEFALPHTTLDKNYSQFEPYYLDSSFTVTRDSEVTEEFGTETSKGTAKSAEREVIKDETTRYGTRTQNKW